MIDGPNADAESVNETSLSLRDELAAEFARMSDDPSETYAEAHEAPTNDEGNQEPSEAGYNRDERGRFAARQAQEEQARNAQHQEQSEPESQQGEVREGQEDGTSKYAGPPPGWSVAAKAAFDDLPEHVKQAVSKREQEIDNGFAKLRDYKGLEPYADLARQANISLPELVKGYRNAELLLEQKPVEALLWLCERYNVDPRQLSGQGQSQQPTQQQQQYQHENAGMDQAIQPLLQEISSLKQQLGRVDKIEKSLYTDKYNSASAQVERFSADPKNRYFNDVADQMVTLINQATAAGQPIDLASIYETACYMNPEVRQALINEKLTADQKAKADKARQAANQARAAGASISGGSSATQPTADPDSSNLRALLEANMAAQMGRT